MYAKKWQVNELETNGWEEDGGVSQKDEKEEDNDAIMTRR